jgi:transposase
MITPTAATRIFVALAPVDLRQSFNGLCAWVQESLRQDPLSGHLFFYGDECSRLSGRVVWPDAEFLVSLHSIWS